MRTNRFLSESVCRGESRTHSLSLGNQDIGIIEHCNRLFLVIVFHTFHSLSLEMITHAIHSDFPLDHWRHLKTTNVVESSFAALRLRTDAAKQFKRVQGDGCDLEDADGGGGQVQEADGNGVDEGRTPGRYLQGWNHLHIATPSLTGSADKCRYDDRMPPVPQPRSRRLRPGGSCLS